MIESQMQYDVEFLRLSPEGKGIAIVDGKNVYVEDVLPGERACIEIPPKSKHYNEGRVIKLLSKSVNRTNPEEEHYHACSPLQIAEYTFQLEIKKNILQNCFKEFAYENIEIETFYSSPKIYSYRNKLEFQFVEEDGVIHLAFNKRESRTEKYVLHDGCMLGSEKMNTAALKIAGVLNEKKIPCSLLKKLTIRESKSTGKILAVLLLNSETERIPLHLSELKEEIDGLVVGYSSPRTPVAIMSKVLYQEGITELEESILGKKFLYPYEGFFQNNVAVFEKAVEEIIKHTPECKKIVELYCGVGVIGLNLAEKAEAVFAVESSTISIKYANRNTHKNNIKNYQTFAGPAENVSLEDLKNTDVLVVDPPRAGLHKKLLTKINSAKPKKIIYLSCNPVTLANDYRFLKDLYTVETLIGLDFYPNTPHIEGLLVLNLK